MLDLNDLSESAINIDEVGVETASLGGYLLKSAYQPIFRRFGKHLIPIGVEALVRPFREGEALSPADFFGGADVDPFRMESVCRAIHMRNYRFLRPHGMRLFFNFSPRVNDDVARVDQRLEIIARRMGELGISMSLFVCEITESEALSDSVLQALIARFREHGMGIALDDFGAGSSTIQRLEQVRPDIVKIDGAWFRRAAAEPRAISLLARLVAGIKDAGSDVLVEGIETDQQLLAAIEIGSDCFQGYRLGRPSLVGTVDEYEPMAVPRAYSGNVTPLRRFG